MNARPFSPHLKRPFNGSECIISGAIPQERHNDPVWPGWGVPQPGQKGLPCAFTGEKGQTGSAASVQLLAYVMTGSVS
jgi:hypothetical protein